LRKEKLGSQGKRGEGAPRQKPEEKEKRGKEMSLDVRKKGVWLEWNYSGAKQKKNRSWPYERRKRWRR